jgi:hypothetical protein
VTFTVAAAVLIVACKEEGLTNGQQCYPGDFEYADAAVSPDGARVTSYLKCTGDGAAYEPYDGDPNAISEGGEAIDTICDLGQEPKLGFMCPGCTTDDQCTTGHCQVFNNKGNHCSHACTSNLDCQTPPSAGCGNNGFCKPQ